MKYSFKKLRAKIWQHLITSNI